jgi:diguanylate cyclase (GGDEF)-like protein
LPAFKSYLAPGSFSNAAVLGICLPAILLIGLLDVGTGANIQMHTLYSFPIAFCFFHCSYRPLMAALFVLSAICQGVTLVADQLNTLEFTSNILIGIGTSSLTAALANTAKTYVRALESSARTDSLTKIANRRAFDDILNREIMERQRLGGVFTLSSIDLDGFKELNDSQGHDAGDLALQLIAEVLKSHLRKTDSLARVGGDEFVILMPNAPYEDSDAVNDTLSRMIVEKMRERGFAVTASIGCKTFTQAPATASAALKEVDGLLYQAKKNGKNCLIHV